MTWPIVEAAVGVALAVLPAAFPGMPSWVAVSIMLLALFVALCATGLAIMWWKKPRKRMAEDKEKRPSRTMIEMGEFSHNNKMKNVKSYGLEFDKLIEDHGHSNSYEDIEAHRHKPEAPPKSGRPGGRRYTPGFRPPKDE